MERALALLRDGQLVAIPTETVYGLAADAENPLAVRRVFTVKGRPSAHPVIVHLAEAALLDAWARDVPEVARRLADAFWPGPLTLVLPRSQRALDVVTGGQSTVGLRVPDHPLTLELLRRFGGGLAAPSANRFGKVSPTRAEHVREDLGDDVGCVLDGGPCRVGVESTIVDCSTPLPRLLRAGGISREQLEAVAAVPLGDAQGVTLRAPGLLPSHYAPRAGVVLASAGELAARVQELRARGQRVAVLAPNGIALPAGVEHLTAPASPEGLAQVLYSQLRQGDSLGVDVVVVQTPAAVGVGAAVLDRLARAAAPRS